MNIPALQASEIVKIIGIRQTSEDTDCVCIIPKSVKFQMSDPPIAIPIPSTSTSTAVDTKIVPLRRVTRKIVITGIIVNGDDSFSFQDVSLSDETGEVSGGSPVSDILQKKWLLEEMFNQGAVGTGVTVQWRGIITPSSNPQSSPPTAPEDGYVNMYHKLGKIIDLSIEDKAETKVEAPDDFEYVPEKMDVTITIQWGSVQG
jgi:hypothetical protein